MSKTSFMTGNNIMMLGAKGILTPDTYGLLRTLWYHITWFIQYAAIKYSVLLISALFKN